MVPKWVSVAKRGRVGGARLVIVVACCVAGFVAAVAQMIVEIGCVAASARGKGRVRWRVVWQRRAAVVRALAAMARVAMRDLART
jgi:hypothetical protein